MRPTAGLDGPVDLLLALVVAVEGDALGGHPGGQGGDELAAGAHVEVQPSSVSHRTTARERNALPA